MKKLLSLFVSAALMCPMWASAQVPTSSTTQTKVGALGIMGWKISGLTLANVFIPPVDNPLIPNVTTINNLYLNMLVPNNSSGLFPINGFVNYSENEAALPVSGTAITTNIFGVLSSDYTYIVLSFSAGFNSITCTITANNLNGSCSSFGIGTTNGAVVTSNASLTYVGLKTE